MTDTDLASILQTLRAKLEQVLGEKVQAVYLFGSRARGDAAPDSDVDVLIVVRGAFDYWDLLGRTSEVVSALSLQHDVVISRCFVTQEQFERGQSPFMLNVRREAVPV